LKGEIVKNEINGLANEIIKQLKSHGIKIKTNSKPFRVYLRQIIRGSKSISDVVAEIVKEKIKRVELENVKPNINNNNKSKSSKFKM